MNTLNTSAQNLLNIENAHIEKLITSLREFEAKLNVANFEKSTTMAHVKGAIISATEYSEYLAQNKCVPGYTNLSNVHRDLRDIIDDLNLALSQDDQSNDFLDFDASQILKLQEAHRKELCSAAVDHTVGRLKKSGDELMEMIKAL